MKRDTTLEHDSSAETHPNPHVRSYHSRQELSPKWIDWNRGHDGRPDGIVGLLSEISGIQEIIASGYSVTVVKGQAFEWAEIEPQILDLLKSEQMEMRP